MPVPRVRGDKDTPAHVEPGDGGRSGPADHRHSTAFRTRDRRSCAGLAQPPESRLLPSPNRLIPMKPDHLLSLSLLLSAAPAIAGNERPLPGDNPWQPSAQAAIVFQPESSLDTGGDVQVTRSFIEGGISRAWASGWRAKLSVGYGEDEYDFSGNAGFGGSDPWGRVRELRFSAFLQYAFDDRWTLFGIPSLRFNAESGASLNDGRTEGLLAGAGYRVSDRLTIGPGLGVFSELEDDTSVFPILIIDWPITDRLSLETGRGFAASRGPGLRGLGPIAPLAIRPRRPLRKAPLSSRRSGCGPGRGGRGYGRPVIRHGRVQVFAGHQI